MIKTAYKIVKIYSISKQYVMTNVMQLLLNVLN